MLVLLLLLLKSVGSLFFVVIALSVIANYLWIQGHYLVYDYIIVYYYCNTLLHERFFHSIVIYGSIKCFL